MCRSPRVTRGCGVRSGRLSQGPPTILPWISARGPGSADPCTSDRPDRARGLLARSDPRAAGQGGYGLANLRTAQPAPAPRTLAIPGCPSEWPRPGGGSLWRIWRHASPGLAGVLGCTLCWSPLTQVSPARASPRSARSARARREGGHDLPDSPRDRGNRQADRAVYRHRRRPRRAAAPSSRGSRRSQLCPPGRDARGAGRGGAELFALHGGGRPGGVDHTGKATLPNQAASPGTIT